MGSVADILRACMEYLRSGGWLMPPIAALAFSIWAGYLLALRRLRSDLASARPEYLSFPEHLDDAAAWGRELAARTGVVPTLLALALQSANGRVGAAALFDKLCEAERNRRFGASVVLAALVASAPLMGLLGTVLGMIATFEAVAGGGGIGGTMADGIRLALVTTQAGLVAALPGTLGAAHLFWLERLLDKRMQACSAALHRLEEPYSC